MSGRGVAGLVFLLMGFMMFMSGGMLTLFLGLEYAMTTILIGFAFMIAGGVAMAAPSRKPQARITFAAAGPPTPRIEVVERPTVGPATPVKLTCPDCGATPSHVGPGVNTCEYCGASFVIPGL